MINLLEIFLEISPVRNLTIVENCQEYLENKEELDKLEYIRVDTLNGRKAIDGIEASDKKEERIEFLESIGLEQKEDELKKWVYSLCY